MCVCVCVCVQELLYLRSHYCVEDFVYMSHHRPEEHGRLHHLILSPAFTPLTKHFMKVLVNSDLCVCVSVFIDCIYA